MTAGEPRTRGHAGGANTGDVDVAYLAYSDGSKGPGALKAWGIAYAPDAHDPDVWVWDETLDAKTGTEAEALAIVHARGWQAESVPGGWSGGWFGDSRDWSYRLTRTPESPVLTGAIKNVSAAGDNLERAKARVHEAESAQRDEVVRALAMGVPAARIAEVLGVSRGRVYQLRDGRR